MWRSSWGTYNSEKNTNFSTSFPTNKHALGERTGPQTFLSFYYNKETMIFRELKLRLWTIRSQLFTINSLPFCRPLDNPRRSNWERDKKVIVYPLSNGPHVRFIHIHTCQKLVAKPTANTTHPMLCNLIDLSPNLSTQTKPRPARFGAFICTWVTILSHNFAKSIILSVLKFHQFACNRNHFYLNSNLTVTHICVCVKFRLNFIHLFINLAMHLHPISKKRNLKIKNRIY